MKPLSIAIVEDISSISDKAVDKTLPNINSLIEYLRLPIEAAVNAKIKNMLLDESLMIHMNNNAAIQNTQQPK